MPLTVKEKEHWKSRIEKKIDKAIERVYRDEGKDFRNSIRQKAEAIVLKRLRLDDYMKQYEKLEAQMKSLREQQKKLSDKAAKPFEAGRDENRYYSDSGHSLIKSVVNREVAAAEKVVLQESEMGRKILRGPRRTSGGDLRRLRARRAARAGVGSCRCHLELGASRRRGLPLGGSG